MYMFSLGKSTRPAAALTLAAFLSASCAEEGATSDDLAQEPIGAVAAAETSMNSFFPIVAGARWTLAPQVFSTVAKNATVTANGANFTLSAFPGIATNLTTYATATAVFGSSGGSFIKLLDFTDVVGSTRVLPSTGLPAGLAGASIKYDSASYAVYDHLLGRNFTGCARFLVTPATGATGTVLTELVFAPNVGPVLVKTRTGANEEWWYLQTSSTPFGAINAPTTPTIPPRTDVALRTLVPVTGGTTPPWRSNPAYTLPAGSLDAALAAVDTQYNAEIVAEQSVTSAFDTGSATQGLLTPTETLGEVFDPAYWIDLGPAAWTPAQLAAYPNLPALTQKADDLATLNNQIGDALLEAGQMQSGILELLGSKRDNLREIRRESVLSLQLEQARYRREITALWVEFGLDVIALIPVVKPVMVTTKVVSRLVRRVGAVTELIEKFRSRAQAFRRMIEIAGQENMSYVNFLSEIRALEQRIQALEHLHAVHVACTQAAGVAALGAITVNGNLVRQLPPSSNNPHEVLIQILEESITSQNQQIAEMRAARTAALDRARQLQLAYKARLAAP